MGAAVELVRRAHTDLEVLLRDATVKRPQELRSSVRAVLAHVGAELIALNTFVCKHAPGFKGALPLLALPVASMRIEVADDASSARWLVDIQDALEQHHRAVETFLNGIEAEVSPDSRAELVVLLERWLEPSAPRR